MLYILQFDEIIVEIPWSRSKIHDKTDDYPIPHSDYDTG
jgi:hypothetical protein